MIKLFQVILIALLISTISLMAGNARKGAKVYSKKLTSGCDMSCNTFAKQHTRSEWKKINDSQKFEEEVAKICNKDTLKVNKKLYIYLYDFVYQYASGSEEYFDCPERH